MPDVLVGGEAGRGCHKPAVTQLPLVQVIGAHTFHKHLGVLTDVLQVVMEAQRVLGA